MKKLCACVLAIVMAASMAACSDSKTISSKVSGSQATTQKVADSQATEGTSASAGVDVTIDTTGNFVFKADNDAKTDIVLGTTDIDSLLQALGTPKSQTDIEACGHDATDHVYTFANYVLTVREMKSGEKPFVVDLYLTSDLIKTPEGLEIGMSKDDVIAKYGDADEADDVVMTYKRGTSVLRITLKTGSVDSIEYMIP